MKEFKFKGIKFLIVVVILFTILFLFDFANSSLAVSKFFDIIWKLLPIFIFIIILTTLINYFLNPKKIMKHFGEESGKRGVFYALFGGIMSHGPMYAWYGMLDDMRKHGLKDGLIVTFIYARAVKLPLLPFMIEIFGILFTVVINIYIVIFAILQGKVMDIVIGKKLNKKEKQMAEKILACDNDICLKKDECERFRLFKAGAKECKTNSGTETKGCGKFIKISK